MRKRLPVTNHIAVCLSIIINILSIRPTERFSISNRVSSSISVLFGTVNFSLDWCTSSVIPHSVSTRRGRCVVQPASMFRFRFYDRQWLVFTKVHRYFYFIDKNEWVSMTVYLEIYFSPSFLKLVIICPTFKKCCSGNGSPFPFVFLVGCLQYGNSIINIDTFCVILVYGKKFSCFLN